MAFVLAIGLVVDDAIVMLENISRHIEEGMNPFFAALKGSREMVLPIIAMTLTLAAVYMPIAFTSGLLSTVFSEFAITLAGTVLISGFIALTLSPMMCSRLLVTQQQNNHYADWLAKRFESLQSSYGYLLAIVLNKRKWIVGSLMIVGLLGCVVFYFMPSELAPTEDMSEVLVFTSAPRNASFQYTDYYARKAEQLADKLPEMESYLAEIGSWSPTEAFQMISLVPREKRSRTSQQVADDLTQQVKQISGVTMNVSVPPPPLTWFTGEDGANVAMQVMSSASYKELHAVMQQLIEAAKKYPGFLHVDSQLKWDGRQFEVSLDREKIAAMRVPIQQVTSTISTLLAGKKVGYFEYGGKQYDIMMQMNSSALANPNIISELYVRNRHEQMVPMSDLITVMEISSPQVLPHFDRLRADMLFAVLAPGYTIEDAIHYFQKITKQILPDNAKYSFVGEAHDYLESSGKIGITFLLALVFIYLILVAQFESFIDPFIILLTVPFAMIGALLTLKLAGGSLNMYTNIGLVTLIGLISKHGILITEFANRERLAGHTIQDAVIKAAKLRLRPILMTTAAMVLGALPLALASGSGSENRQQIGMVIVGGLLLGTFFSLIVVPVAYTYLAKFKRFDYVATIKAGEQIAHDSVSL